MWRYGFCLLIVGCHITSGLDAFTEEEGSGGAGVGGSGAGGSPAGMPGTGGMAGQGGDGGEGGTIVAELTDGDLIARWFLHDAMDAGGPVADASPNGHDLNFAPQNNAATYEAPMGMGKGIQWEGFVGGRLELIQGTNFMPAFNNRKRVMIEIVMGALFGESTASRVVYLGPFNADGDLAVTVSDDSMDLRINTMTAAQWPTEPLTMRRVHHICMDLDLPAAEAVWAYLDGVPRRDKLPLGGMLPAEVVLGMNPDFLIGNSNGVNASPQGRIGYVALYEACLPDTVIMGHAQRLLASDDP